jgi:hypothetical protein
MPRSCEKDDCKSCCENRLAMPMAAKRRPRPWVLCRPDGRQPCRAAEDVRWPNSAFDTWYLIGSLSSSKNEASYGSQQGRGQLPVRIRRLPVCGNAELDPSLPLRELSARNLFSNDDMDFRAA